MPVEAIVPDSFRQDLVDQGIAIRTEALWKTYEMGAEKLRQLCAAVNLDIRKARIRCHHAGFLQGSWQVHTDELDRVLRYSDLGEILAGWALS